MRIATLFLLSLPALVWLFVLVKSSKMAGLKFAPVISGRHPTTNTSTILSLVVVILVTMVVDVARARNDERVASNESQTMEDRLADARAREECAEEKIVEIATECAKHIPSFVQCVVAGDRGVKGQCKCILESDEMKICLGHCLRVIEDSMCPSMKWQPGTS